MSDEFMRDSYRCWYPVLSELRPVSLTAKDRGSLMRFANHSSGENNMRFVVLDGDDGWYHVAFITCRSVSPQQQLLVDYGPQYWRGKERPLELLPDDD